MALIHEMRAVQAAESSGNPTDVFLLSMARQNLTALMTAIGKMEEYWAGTSYVAQILEKRTPSPALCRIKLTCPRVRLQDVLASRSQDIHLAPGHRAVAPFHDRQGSPKGRCSRHADIAAREHCQERAAKVQPLLAV